MAVSIIDSIKVKILPFNYKRFWKKRYNKYGYSIFYSGNKGLNIQDNLISYRRNIQAFLKLIKKHGISKDSSILDIGCGFGMYANSLKEAGYKDYKGIDLNGNIVNKLKTNFSNGFKFEQKDVCKDKIDGTYDLVFMLDVTLHIINDRDFEFIIHNIKDSLKEGGIAVINDMDIDERTCYYMKRRLFSYYERIFGTHITDTAETDYGKKKLFVLKKL